MRLSRRLFLRLALYGLPLGAVAYAGWIEPRRLTVRRLNLASGKPAHRFVHFTDLHHKGDRALLDTTVRAINAQSPEFVCFTGDLIKEVEYLPEALDGLQQIRAPLYGVPGNHDYWSRADFDLIGAAFARTGGRWLLDESVTIAGGGVHLAGFTCNKPPQLRLDAGRKTIVLIHYPAWVDKLGDYRFDVALAGHSHRGQVRLPFIGPLIVPFGVERHDLGLFQTPSGPLYVGAGVGWFYLRARLNCPPEIAVIEI